MVAVKTRKDARKGMGEILIDFPKRLDMNIMLLTTTLNKGGAERVAVSLANQLCKTNGVIIVKLSDSKPQYTIADRIVVESIHIDNGNVLSKVIYRVKEIQNVVNKYKIDVIITFSMQLSMYPIVAKLGCNVKVVASEHSNPYYRRRSKVMEFFMSLILPHADGYIFLTEEGRDFYGKRIASKSAIIPNPLSSVGLPAELIDFSLRDPNKICAVGSLRAVKDHDTMLRAFSIVHKEKPNVLLHIYGEGEEKARLMELCRKLDIKDNVIFEGIVDDIYSSIGNSYVFVQTSVSESWGCALQEAMACGIPCVSTDCDFGPRKMIVDGESGFLVEVKDFEAVAKCIILLLQDEELSKRMSNNAFKTREQYSIERISKRYEEFLQKVNS